MSTPTEHATRTIGADLSIGELAEQTQVSTRLLRYYEAQGLLHAGRRANGYRRYDAEAVGTVQRIRLLLGAGLSTALIAEVLPCVQQDGSSIAPTCPDSRARLAAERRRLRAQIDDLRASEALLEQIVES